MLDVGRPESIDKSDSFRAVWCCSLNSPSCAENVDLDIQIWCVAQHLASMTFGKPKAEFA